LACSTRLGTRSPTRSFPLSSSFLVAPSCSASSVWMGWAQYLAQLDMLFSSPNYTERAPTPLPTSPEP
jgi:hypothetical protein